MKKIIYLILLLILTTSVLPAQKNFTDGGLIQSNGDTLHGQIDYQEWDLNPSGIQFRPSSSGAATAFDYRNIAGFFVTGKNEIYQTATVYINNEPSDMHKMPSYSSVGEAIRNFRPVRDTVFLRVLARGKLSLYEYKDNNGAHYLAQPEGDTIRELVARKVNVNSNTVPLDEYKNQLKFMTVACSTLGVNFDKLTYSDKTLLDVVKKFNQCTGNSVYSVQQEKAGKSIYLMAGAGFPSFELSGPLVSDNTHDDEYTLTGLAPVFGVGCDFNFSRARGKRGGGLELYASQYSLDHAVEGIFGRALTYKVDMGYLRMLAFFRQTLTTGKVSPYLKAGIGATYYFKSDVSYSYISSAGGMVENIRPTKKGDVCFIGGVGARMGRFHLEARFEWGSNLAEFDASETLKANMFSLVAAYSFIR
ncbi:MAG TPA: hypothetical protein PK228_22600 [Saprospiraceae bacterium]|nr:hypothetical protein [Saprospiraceae bacterium]